MRKGSRDGLLDAIEAIHAAGLDGSGWTKALSATTDLFGCTAATLEMFDKHPLASREYRDIGMPPLSEIEYLDYWATQSPRLPHGAKKAAGEITFDYELADERGLDRMPFYAEFLPRVGIRYFLAGVVFADRQGFSAISMHRSRKEGHFDASNIALMRRIMPHVAVALGVSRRLKAAGVETAALASMLDRLAEGLALLSGDGRVLYANRAFEAMLRLGDGLRSVGGTLAFAAAGAAARFARALRAASRLAEGDARANIGGDFVAERPSGAPAYVVSLSPVGRGTVLAEGVGAAVILFIRDPLERDAAPAQMLRDLFGLTAAEAHFAQALQAGISPSDYASEAALSLNTVYTHLRHVKEKTGERRTARLRRKLSELRISLRAD
jgi:DNA-binding CsgD family transcriptional regulator